jgi:DMSO reductase anchor subunit
MHPPWSMIFFTTLAGAAQGLLLALLGVDLARSLGLLQAPDGLFLAGAVITLAMCGVGLVAASFHLGHPWRGWRAMAMWRTSWLSREVIVLPAFMAAVAAWGLAHALHVPALGWGLLAALLALALYVCTGMIYGAVKAIREWATPLTPINYTLIGLASGALLASALAAFMAPALAPALARLALVATLVAALARGYAFWRNQTLVPGTTLQTAIGVRHPRIVQKSQGAMGGSFNTREFFHGRPATLVTRVRWAAALLGFVLPAAALAAASAPSGPLLALLFVLQYAGLLAERWSFFTEANHPQNLYYRAIA